MCQEIPRAAATRETDMHSRARARSPHSTAERVSRALGSAKLEVSCLHTRRQWVQANHQLRGPPPHRHVGQAPGHPLGALRLAAAAGQVLTSKKR